MANLPPGPRAPRAVQTLALWTRTIPLLERCRARYGKRFTLRLLQSPPGVHLSDPAEVKEVFTAPPEVLHPGEGAQILEPVVGANSVILLDERVPPHNRLQALTMEVILRAVFGLDPGARLEAIRERLSQNLELGNHP